MKCPNRHRVIRCPIIIGGSCHKYHLCRDKCFVATNTSFVATKVCLLCQKNCREKISLSRQNVFVSTKLLSRQIFVATNIIFVLLKFCRDKHTFVAISILLSRQNTCLLRQDTSFIATKVFTSRQMFCRDKHSFVATKDVICRVCVVFDKTFVATKMILVAVLASDSLYRPVESALPRAL